MTIIGNDKTKPKVGLIPTWNPAYIGRTKPKRTYKPVTIRESTKEEAVNPIIKTIKSCKETLMLSPKGKANIPMTHNRASNMAFLVILCTEIVLFINHKYFTRKM